MSAVAVIDVPASPLECMALAMGVPRPFVAWLSDQGLTKPEELAMVCSKESDIEAALIDASAVPFARLIDRVAVTKLWLQARSRVDRSVGLQSGRATEDQDEKLDEETNNDIWERWGQASRFPPGRGPHPRGHLVRRAPRRAHCEP